LNGTNYLLGTGKGLTLKDISKILESLTKKKCNIIWGAKPYRKSDVMHAVAQNTELINLGWSVKTSIEKGLKYLLKI
jgi:CDP-paratose synthetase